MTASRVKCQTGAMPAKIAAPMAPVSPPRLYMPCRLEMHGRPRRRSTSTAWVFMATSMVAKVRPTSSSPAARYQTLGASPSNGKQAISANPETTVIARLPWRRTNAPAKTNASSAPTPAPSNAWPSCCSSTPVMFFSAGTRPIRLPCTMPPMAKQ